MWKTQGNINDLLSKILNVSTGCGFTEIPSTPVKMVINGVSSTDFRGDSVYFANRFPLQNSLTKFTVNFTYHYAAPMDIDSTRTFDILVKSDPGAKVPADIATNCREQGTIKFYVNNVEIPAMFTDDPKVIEVRYFPVVSMSQNAIELKIANTVTGAKDSLTVYATKQSNYYTVFVTRETANPKIDNTLQTNANDSIAVRYENPDFPLDVVRATRSICTAVNLGTQLPVVKKTNAPVIQIKRNNMVVIKCSKAKTIRLSVIDIRGRVVSTVKNAVYSAGTYNIGLNMDGCGSNTYFVKLTTNDNEIVQKITLLK